MVVMAMGESAIPFAGCFAPSSAPAELGFLGIADDSQSSYRRGCSSAPERIRNAYDGRCFNATSESGVDLTASVSDLGDLTHRGSWESSARHYRQFMAARLKEGKTLFIAGGDHAVTVPVAEALAAFDHPVHVIQIDAHPDLYPEFEGNPNSHACVAARILEMDHIASVTQLGIRTLNAVQSRQLERFHERLRLLFARDLSGELPSPAHIPEGAAVYITIDLDGFDPSIAPGVSHPVPGGVSARQVLNFIQRGHWNLVGMDVVELNPTLDANDQTAILAARLLHEGMGYAALARGARRR